MFCRTTGVLLTAFLSCSAFWACTAPAPGEVEPELDLVAFGSCARQDRPQPIWDTIRAHEPDLFLFIGDNVYADLKTVPEDPAQIAEAYAALATLEPWQRFRAAVPVLATWDDHDYGKNDAGVEWALKGASQELFADFFDAPEDSPLREREGIYDVHLLGPTGHRVQVILLDTRTFRDPLTRKPQGSDLPGRYVPGEVGALLGEAQWTWLEEQLAVEADLRIVCSSIQFVAGEHGWEGWANFPHERTRMLELIARRSASGVCFVSGDRHLIELSCQTDAGAPYPVWDFTSSGLNQADAQVSEPNRYRVGPVLRTTNFGLIRIDWATRGLTFEGRGAEDQVLLSQEVALDELRAP
ncbi:MAG: alkaline phosphatase family protein [bacterium]|nr:alkaline phosphatase family protein [bacterium]